MRPIVYLAAATLLVASLAAAQESNKTPVKPPRETERKSRTPKPFVTFGGRVDIGETAQDFALDGSRGLPVKLSTLRGDWVLLTFVNRFQEVLPLRKILDDLPPLGAQLVGVCHEKAHTLQSRAVRDSVPFLLLADVTGEVSALYGLFNYQRSETRPGFVVIDRKGIVRLAVLGQALPPEDVLRLAQYVITGS